MDEGRASARSLAGGSTRVGIGAPWRRRCLLVALPSAAALAIAGCSVSAALKEGPGVDLSELRPGTTRSRVEALVGAPLREWTTHGGVRYCMYRYDAGFGPDRGNAAVAVFFDVVSFGLFEVFQAVSDDALELRGKRKHRLLAVSYDAQDVAIGVFDDIGEFSDLPADGRPTAGPASGASPAR